jgi:3-methyladenine DNA glycosylase AlkD
MRNIISQIRTNLKACSNEKTMLSAQRYFKEQSKFYGVKTAEVGKIAKTYWTQVKTLEKSAIFDLCEELYSSDYTEEAFVVAFWLPNYISHLDLADLQVFRCWIDRYINNWAKCDGFCNHTVGDLILKCPEGISELKSWAKSTNRWLRRASAVSLVVPARRGLFLREAFEICNLLLSDTDDMVQKGYGWLLKEESRLHQAEVYNYVLKNRSIMPRTALRYAIELMPKELKTEAMNKP